LWVNNGLGTNGGIDFMNRLKQRLLKGLHDGGEKEKQACD